MYGLQLEGAISEQMIKHFSIRFSLPSTSTGITINHSRTFRITVHACEVPAPARCVRSPRTIATEMHASRALRDHRLYRRLSGAAGTRRRRAAAAHGRGRAAAGGGECIAPVPTAGRRTVIRTIIRCYGLLAARGPPILGAA